MAELQRLSHYDSINQLIGPQKEKYTLQCICVTLCLPTCDAMLGRAVIICCVYVCVWVWVRQRVCPVVFVHITCIHAHPWRPCWELFAVSISLGSQLWMLATEAIDVQMDCISPLISDSSSDTCVLLKWRTPFEMHRAFDIRRCILIFFNFILPHLTFASFSLCLLWS